MRLHLQTGCAINTPLSTPALVSAAVVLCSGFLILLIYDLGHLSTHMMLHIATMNVAAPSVAALIVAFYPLARHFKTTASGLWAASLIQIVALWAWHAPAVHDVVTHSFPLTCLTQGTLLIAALTFWLALLTTAANVRWQTIPALLLTGKLACLLAALLIFAPRTLYASTGHTGHIAALPAAASLDDQHLAGLLMITACPLSYLVAAVIITVQLITPPPSPASAVHQNAPVG